MNSLPLKISFVTFLCAVAMIWPGCRTDGVATEPVKDISGVWKIDKIVQNGKDITEWMDPGEFQLIFESDTALGHTGSGSYKIVEGLPFVVSTDGVWKFDSPVYPVYISFSPGGDAEPVQVGFLYPVVGGRRQISLIFNPGCPSNTYEYLLKKVNE